ncbi:MAG: 6-bladed beta-propeller [Salinivirgaceae bacterium]|nr:6-bladed beta-propeller [Salinivirgaceae bacterium]
MKTNIITIAAICTAMMACNSNQTDTAVTNRVELPGTVDNEAFANNVESISVMNLQMGDDWTFMSEMNIGLSDSYIYMADQIDLRLSCYDRKTGAKLAERTLKGNGPGETIGINSLFCVGDTCCIYDTRSVIRQYNQNCNYIGKMHEFSNLGWCYHIVRLNSGDYAFVSPRNDHYTDSATAALILADKSFNITSEHFAVSRAHTEILGSDPCYVDDDTIRMICAYDNHIYSLCSGTEQCIELVVPNPITPEKANELFDIGDFKVLRENFKMAREKYDGPFHSLCGSGRFLSFGYHFEKEDYWAMLDKHTNKVVSIQKTNNDVETTADIVSKFFTESVVVKLDSDQIYVQCKNGTFASILEGNDNLLDARLRETQAQYRAYLERNAEYLKGLDEDERDAANVILKIKLKD